MIPANDNITVCICTFKRPELLKALLTKLNRQVTDGLYSFSIVVVDNDLNQSSKSTVQEIKQGRSLEIDYYCEPEQNIALARNRAISNAKGNFVAFIDDDELPDDMWLLLLLRAYYKNGGDGIQGPVFPSYEKGVPEWVKKGDFYGRPNYQTGMVLSWSQGRTGNLLVRRDIFKNPDNLFDPKFGRGAEDQDFFRRSIENGHVFKYCHEAVAYEYIPPHRWKRVFLLKRALLRGKISLLHPTSKVKMIAKSVVAIPIYTCILPFLLIAGHHLFMKFLVKDFDHIGRILGLFGLDVIKQKYVSE